jgi:HSP20 family molecular chaperone IbpA
MRAERGRKNSNADEKLTVVALSASEQTRKTQEAIARRAYEIFVSRGAEYGHELKDWRQAESELIKPLCCGLMSAGENLWVEADPTVFEPGSIEIWAAARNITICGKPSRSDINTHKAQTAPNWSLEMIFRVLDLPLEIDPSGVTAKFRGPSLEILLRKAQAKPQQVKTAAALCTAIGSGLLQPSPLHLIADDFNGALRVSRDCFRHAAYQETV